MTRFERRHPLADGGRDEAPVALCSLLDGVVAELGAAEKLAECRALLAWEAAAGEVLAAQARPLRIRKGRLELAVPSAVWRTQVTFAREELVRRINELAGVIVVREIAIVNQPLEKGLTSGLPVAARSSRDRHATTDRTYSPSAHSQSEEGGSP